MPSIGFRIVAGYFTIHPKRERNLELETGNWNIQNIREDSLAHFMREDSEKDTDLENARFI